MKHLIIDETSKAQSFEKFLETNNLRIKLSHTQIGKFKAVLIDAFGGEVRGLDGCTSIWSVGGSVNDVICKLAEKCLSHCKLVVNKQKINIPGGFSGIQEHK
jgi:hypothetical protein